MLTEQNAIASARTQYRDVFAARAQRLEREATEARAVVLTLADRVEA